MLIGEIDVALALGRHFDDLGVIWVVGGSVASSLLGEPRATADVDLVADLRIAHIEPLCARLAGGYYVDEDTMRWAVAERRMFNTIQLASMIKADVYCSKGDALGRGQLERRIVISTPNGPIPVTSAEDIILQKLLWFVEGGQVSDRQWRDLIGVVRVHEAKLDLAYVEERAREHALVDMLAKLYDAARLG